MTETVVISVKASMDNPSFIFKEAQVPRNIADVLKHVDWFINVRRKEDGFDFSGPNDLLGELSPFKGGSHYFNYHQNQQVQRILDRYDDMHKGKVAIPHNIEKVMTSLSHIGRLSGSCKSTSHGIRDTILIENHRLFRNIVQLVAGESCKLPAEASDKMSSLSRTSSVTASSSQINKSATSISALSNNDHIAHNSSKHSVITTSSTTKIHKPRSTNRVNNGLSIAIG